MDEVFVIWIGLLILCSGVGFLIGKFHERLEWNLLIQEGKINKPGRKS